MNMLTKNNRIANRVITMILGTLPGVILVILGAVVDVGALLGLAMVVWGVITIISNIPMLVYSIANIQRRGAVFDLVIAVGGILLGVGYIVSQNQVITLLLAAYMIIFPTIRIILAKSNRKEQLKREMIRIILGVVLMVFGGTLLAVGEKVLKLLLTVIGWVIIGLSLLIGLWEILRIGFSKPTERQEPIYVEHEEL